MKHPKVGIKIQATARNAMGKKRANQRYGALSTTKRLTGQITAQMGRGTGRKWRVRWDDESVPPCDLTARRLEPHMDAVADPEALPAAAEAPAAAEVAGSAAQPVDPAGGAEEAPTDPLLVKGVQWRVDPNLIDARDRPRMRARMLWSAPLNEIPERSRREIEYMMWSFPEHSIPGILARTTERMQAVNSKTSEVTRGEFWKCVGYLLAMTRTRKRRRDLFSRVDGLFPAPAFGKRFGVSRERFELILKHLSLGVPDPSDPAAAMLDFIDQINHRRIEGYYPCWSICVDESMSSWRGKDGNFCSDGMPHVTKIDRKPKGVGAELKDAACSETNIIIRLEYQLGKEKMQLKDYTNIHNAGTAQTLRLTQPWHNTGRTINADSAFASVATAVACKAIGLEFKGIVKTATASYPMHYLRTIEYKERGDWVTLVAEIDSHKIFATGWGDMTRKNLVHTDGASSAGSSHRKRRWRECDDGDGTEVEWRETKRPKVVEEYFDAAKVIDVHNHMRQGGLALEEAWATKSWEHRLASTLIGMIETDAFLAMKHFQPHCNDIDHADFTEELAFQLLTNDFDNIGVSTRGGGSPEKRQGTLDHELAHDLCQISSHPKYGGGKLSSNGKPVKALYRCAHCNEMATVYCKTCTSKLPACLKDRLVAVCSLNSKRGSRCINDHFRCDASDFR